MFESRFIWSVEKAGIRYLWKSMLIYDVFYTILGRNFNTLPPHPYPHPGIEFPHGTTFLELFFATWKALPNVITSYLCLLPIRQYLLKEFCSSDILQMEDLFCKLVMFFLNFVNRFENQFSVVF